MEWGGVGRTEGPLLTDRTGRGGVGSLGSTLAEHVGASSVAHLDHNRRVVRARRLEDAVDSARAVSKREWEEDAERN